MSQMTPRPKTIADLPKLRFSTKLTAQPDQKARDDQVFGVRSTQQLVEAFDTRERRLKGEV